MNLDAISRQIRGKITHMFKYNSYYTQRKSRHRSMHVY